MRLAPIFLVISFSQEARSQITFGIFADCQYCDCESKGTRYYSNSLEKMQECINEFNKNKNIEFVVGLGDLIDRDFSSFDSVIPILSQSKTKVFHVVGNHDLAVDKELLGDVPKKLNLNKTWYSFTEKDWRFIFLNGIDITFQSKKAGIVKKAEILTAKLKEENKPNFQKWNGGIGKKQLRWMEKQLKKAQKKQQKAMLFCHYPIVPFDSHSLWNAEEVLRILKRYNSAKCWINGHNHEGNYTFSEGIHFLNLKGMVETENTNAFSIIKITGNKIEVDGFGNEQDRILTVEK